MGMMWIMMMPIMKVTLFIVRYNFFFFLSLQKNVRIFFSHNLLLTRDANSSLNICSSKCNYRWKCHHQCVCIHDIRHKMMKEEKKVGEKMRIGKKEFQYQIFVTICVRFAIHWILFVCSSQVIMLWILASVVEREKGKTTKNVFLSHLHPLSRHVHHFLVSFSFPNSDYQIVFQLFSPFTLMITNLFILFILIVMFIPCRLFNL